MAPKVAAAAEGAVVKKTGTESVGEPARKRGRTRNAERPRIDIDDEIERANELATIMKKLSHAAKMEQRNATRCKARLLKKCAKVSAQDLERLAVLKRCGLFPADGDDDGSAKAKSGAAGSGDGNATSSLEKKAGGPAMKRIAEVMQKTKPQRALRSMELVQAFMKGYPTLPTDDGSDEDSIKKQSGGGVSSCAAEIANEPTSVGVQQSNDDDASEEGETA